MCQSETFDLLIVGCAVYFDTLIFLFLIILGQLLNNQAHAGVDHGFGFHLIRPNFCFLHGVPFPGS